MTTKFKKSICTALATCLVLCFTPLAASAAAKKPAKVAKPSVKVSGKIADIKWKKAKNAKKYQVKIQKKNGSNWSTKKTAKVKGTSYSFTGAWNSSYRVYVRGLAEKNGSWSKAASFKIGKQGSGNKKSASGDTGEIPTVKTYARGLKKGKTYYVISYGGDYKKKVTVTDSGEMKKGEDLIFSDYWCADMTGTTSDGGTLHCRDSSDDRIYTYEGKDCYKLFSEQNTNDGHIVKILADDVNYVWTLDGTEPKLGQEDYYGTSDKYAQYHNKPVKMQLRGSFHKNRMSGVYEKEVLSDPYCWWVKVYKGKKIIFDSRVEKYDKFSKSK